MVIGVSISRDYLATLIKRIMALPTEKPKKPTPTENLSLEPDECDIMDYLVERQNCLACEMGEHLKLSRVVVWGTLVKLRTKGFVTSNTPTSKRKARCWYITDKGKRAAITPQRWAV